MATTLPDACFCTEHVKPLSQYGQVQNVQNYSSNPFWSPNGGYNQGMPVAVYVTGPDLTTGDCQRTLTSLIANICDANNFCHGMQLSDVRPAVVLQLSRMSGHNWATSCMGYIDSAFDTYMRNTAGRIKSKSFPSATSLNTNVNAPVPQITNPFAPNIPTWLKDMKAREAELKELQSYNGDGYEHLSYSEFPVTYEDLSFTERLANETVGYLPYKDESPYRPLKIKPVERKTTTVQPSNNVQGTETEEQPADPTPTCATEIQAAIQNYFNTNPWASFNNALSLTPTCTQTDSDTRYTMLDPIINEILSTNPKCQNIELTSHQLEIGPGSASANNTFYMEFNITYQQTGDVYVVDNISVKKCCMIITHTCPASS